MKIKKQALNNAIELVLIIIFLTLSLINVPLFILSLLMSVILIFKQKGLGILKLIIILVFRYVLSEGLDNLSDTTLVPVFKYFILLGIAPLYLIYNYKILIKDKIFIKFLKITSSTMVLFIFISFIGTEYYLMSFLKILNYFVPLVIIVSLITLISEKEKFLFWFSNIFKIMICISLLLIKSPIGYLRNGFSFQGILNHPNLFGIILVIGILTILIEMAVKNKISIMNIIIVLLGIYELILSNSRTSLLSFVVCLIVFFMFSNIKKSIKSISIITTFLIGILVYIIPTTNNFITNYIQKGQSSDQILLSRYGQIDNTLYVLQNSPVFGIGFGIPVNRTSFELNGFTYEAGNLFFGLLSYVGILGLCIYIFYLIYIIFIQKSINNLMLSLFLGSILINMGELVMFSSNNVGIICYVVWGIYIQESMRTQNENI
ncbi:O-antigen ligase family protein [Mammaliicoccus vitulinus]|uniref:O-antigen ligase family protein n=1 Tax=Mammaliicoccus vitulinus TaxID=71237 RepID=UPI001ADFD449|nr:O-antigen ligase family protein [Mammaliicoccus vitulinus]QTN10577.1 O-antigen ligase domain-containing protein [Mammaliicoccus vitulinus]